MYTYTCLAEDKHALSHCQEGRLLQCDYCKWYEAGNGAPHYPVPAIRCGYEIGWSLSSAEPSLIYWEQGAYYD